MAESAVTLVIDKLVPLITQEVRLLKGVHEEIGVIKGDLEAIQAFLKDADSKVEKEGISEGVRVWVKEAREIAYQIEDVIDKYMLHVAWHPDSPKCFGYLKQISFSVKKLLPRHVTASEARRIRKTVREVRDRTEKLQFIPCASRSNAGNIISHDPRLSSISVDDKELVHIESQKDTLTSLLVNGTPTREVISVVGLGGVGKTTISRKIYDNQSVRSHFRCHAWVTVSQSYDRKELLKSVLEKFYEEKKQDFPPNFLKGLAKMTDDSLLSRKIKEYLQKYRYLVVFDDVWDIAFWEQVKHALLDNNEGSRILITTRNEGVANFCQRSCLVHKYRMKPLPHNQAWELFCKKAFGNEVEGKCPQNLENLSEAIVRRCGGLPLIIVAVGGLLARKEKTLREWEKFLDCLSSALVGDVDLVYVTKIISLSYGDLPYSLKSCFLYLGLFPEDFCITSRRLIQLWIAEGFVEEKRGKKLEEVAEEFLTELIHRNLIEGAHDERIPKTVQVHDIVREVILSKSEELSLCHISSSCPTFHNIARHLSISDRNSGNPRSSTQSQTRSIMFFHVMELQQPTIDVIFAKCRLLTTLDFENCRVDQIPKELGKLLHLRYLNLRDTNVSELPKTIGKLHNLESLDLSGTEVKELPVEINRFPKLRHLLGGPRGGGGLKIRGSIGQLKFLQTLFIIDFDVRLINEVGTWKQMRKLGIDGWKKEHGMDQCISLGEMTNLRSWWVSSSNFEDEILEVQSVSSPPPNLQILKLRGKLEKLPEWIPKLDNLSKLKLLYSCLMIDPIEVLQNLPRLESLVCYGGYSGTAMHFGGGGFQKLKSLDLSRLKKLNTVIIDDGAMPVLEELSIKGCHQLKEVPSGIQHLKGLKSIFFGGMSNDFKQRLSREGADYQIVQHIQTIRC